MNNYRLLFLIVFTLLVSELSAQVKFQRAWFYTAVDTVSAENIEKQLFKPLNNPQDVPPFQNKGIYWFRLDIENKNPNEDLIIHIKNPHLDSVFLFQRNNGEIVLTDTAGNDHKLRDSSYLRFTKFKISGETSNVWLKTRLKKRNPLPCYGKYFAGVLQSRKFELFKVGDLLWYCHHCADG